MNSHLEKTGMCRRRNGFTLVELLMVISIIAILSTLSIAIIRSAENDAREARTASIVGNVRNIVQRKFEQYETRTIPFRFSDIDAVTGMNRADDLDYQRDVRRRVLAEWIRSELPISVVDGGNSGLERFPSEQSITNADVSVQEIAKRLRFRPTAMVTRLRRHFAMVDSDTDGVYEAHPSFDPQHQAAECLYAILYNSWDDDRRGTHFLSASEIGDTDGDGFPEVLDAWGDPLVFDVTINLAAIDPDDITIELNDFQIYVNSQRFN